MSAAANMAFGPAMAIEPSHGRFDMPAGQIGLPISVNDNPTCRPLRSAPFALSGIKSYQRNGLLNKLFRSNHIPSTLSVRGKWERAEDYAQERRPGASFRAQCAVTGEMNA